MELQKGLMDQGNKSVPDLFPPKPYLLDRPQARKGSKVLNIGAQVGHGLIKKADCLTWTWHKKLDSNWIKPEWGTWLNEPVTSFRKTNSDQRVSSPSSIFCNLDAFKMLQLHRPSFMSLYIYLVWSYSCTCVRITIGFLSFDTFSNFNLVGPVSRFNRLWIAISQFITLIRFIRVLHMVCIEY